MARRMRRRPSENPPLSGLDLPSLEPNAAPAELFAAGRDGQRNGGFQRSEHRRAAARPSVPSPARWEAWTLRRTVEPLRSGRSITSAARPYYSVHGHSTKLLQQMDLDQKITWKRGAFSLRDSFSYLPEGNFGASYGSRGRTGIGSLGNTSFGRSLAALRSGSLGLAPRILNVSIADVTESLTPRSSVTAAGGYAFTHFYGSDVQAALLFLGVTADFSASWVQPPSKLRIRRSR